MRGRKMHIHRFYEAHDMISRATEYKKQMAHLDEPDGCRLLAEALSAKVKSVLADETSLVGAQTAVEIAETKSDLSPEDGLAIH